MHCLSLGKPTYLSQKGSAGKSVHWAAVGVWPEPWINLNDSRMDLQLYRFLRLEYVVFCACVICFLFWAGYWSVHILAIVYGKAKLHKRRVLDLEKNPLPGVSIIKPLVGVDLNLASNLATFFHLKYPKYEILFCVHDEHDSALPVVRSLVEKHPQVQTAVFIGGCKVGLNPKVNNMMPAYLAAQYDFILISDSGLRSKLQLQPFCTHLCSQCQNAFELR
ncbi:hypothetical protein D918_04715 [Trichuris suis]|nr:hypothetical protein D918_04715 [Trichuris suis]